MKTLNEIKKNKLNRKHDSFAIGAIIITIGMLAVKIFGAIFKIPLMSILGGEGSGYFVGAYNLYNPIYALSTAGLPIAISRLVSESITLGRFKDVKKINKITAPIFLVTGIVGFILIIFGSFVYVKFAKSPGALYSIFMLAPTLLFSCLMSTYRGYYEGLRQMIPTAVSEIIESIGKVIFGLSFVYILNYYVFNEYQINSKVFGRTFNNFEELRTFILPFSSAAALTGVALSAFLGFIYMYLRHKILGDGITARELLYSPPAKSNKEILKSILKISIPVALGAIVMNIAGVVDSVLIQRRLASLSPNNLSILLKFYNNLISSDIVSRKVLHIFLTGCYGYTYTIIMFLPTISGGISISTLPTVTSAWVSGIKEELQKNISIITKLSALISIPMGIGLSALSFPIIDLVYSNINPIEKHIAASVMAISGIGAIFTSLSTPICSMLQAVGRADLPVKILCFGVLVKIILNYILVGIPEINIQGAGIGTLLCYLIVFLLSFYNLLKITKIKLNLFSIFSKITIASVICAISAWTFYFFFVQILNLNSKIFTLFSIFMSGIIYIFTVIILKTLTYDDLLALPKGEKIAKFLKLDIF